MPFGWCFEGSSYRRPRTLVCVLGASLVGCGEGDSRLYYAFWGPLFLAAETARRARDLKRVTSGAQSSTMFCVLGPVFWVPEEPGKNGVQTAIPVSCFRGWPGRVALAEFLQTPNKRTRKRVQIPHTT